MKKKEIIKLIKEKNSSELTFSNNYSRLADELDLTEQNLIFQPTRGKTMLILKYATIFLLVVSLSFTGVMFGRNTKDSPKNINYLSLADAYFNENSVQHIDNPIRTEIIDDSEVNVYIGLSEDEEVVFLFVKEESAITNIYINTESLETRSVGHMGHGNFAYAGDGCSFIETFHSTQLDSLLIRFNGVDSDNNYKFTIGYLDEINDFQTYVVSINPTSYIEYLKRTNK